MRLCNWENSLSETVLIAIVVMEKVVSLTTIWSTNLFRKQKDADGFVFGTPVYYAHPSGRLLSFLDRAFYSSASSRIYKPFQFKPAAAIASARRAGTTASIDVINKYFSIAMMPIVSSTYWNMVHGLTPEDVMQDKEGLQTMRNIGKNMAWMLQCIACAKQHNIPQPQPDVADSTNFIH